MLENWVPHMRWSKLKQIVQSRLAPSLADRVKLETTHYRQAHDQEGRWGVVIDGEQVYGLGCIVADREISAEFTRLREQGCSIGEATKAGGVRVTRERGAMAG